MHIFHTPSNAVPALLATCVFAMAGIAQAPLGTGENAKLTADFQQRATKYLDLRKQVAGKSPKATDSPEAIDTNQKKLGDAIRAARVGAKQGEIFTPELTAFFRRQIAAALNGSKGNEIRASLKHADPVNLKLQVNQTYPEKAPLQSTPPSLLQSLPEPPQGLEYRIVGRDLVLRDTEANIVVDFIPNAIPQ
jgi:hypothetical protein